ncbi:MAG: hypothetical protein Kow0027_08270 [Saprospiraceae bacterium]
MIPSALRANNGEPVLTLTDANGDTYRVCLACDNVINGGVVEGNEFGCPNPDWDPSLITNVVLPTGGTGDLEFVWIFTTDDPTDPFAQWTPIPNTNAPEFDPGPISVTTYFRRCARRSGCTDYVGESNIIMKEAICCDNVTDGGEIGASHTTCTFPFDPAPIVSVTDPTGGSGDLEFQWVMSNTPVAYDPASPDWVEIPGADSIIYDPDTVFQNTYFIRLSRRHGCTDYLGVSNMVSVTLDNTLSIDTLISFSPTCFNGDDGSISMAVSGGATPYAYFWSNNIGDVEDPQGLSPGTYYVTIMDPMGCSLTDSIEVDNAPEMEVYFSVVAESCLGANDGAIGVDSVGLGVGPFSFVWSDSLAQTSQYINNLPPGDYTVTVTDANGCTTAQTAAVPFGNALQLTLEATSPGCFGEANGTATVVSVTGGLSPFQFQWDDPLTQTTQTASGLSAGQYSVTVTDTIGCAGSASVTIPEGVIIETTVVSTDASCFNSPNGAATVTATGGMEPYTYAWSDILHQTSATAVNLAPGTYTVTVTDSTGCSTVDTAMIQSPPPIELALNSTPVSCAGGSDGSVSVAVVSGINGPFIMQWNDPANSTGSVVNDLPAGSYFVIVSDTMGCAATGSVEVTEPSPIELSFASQPASCFNSSDGSLEVTATGGTTASPGVYQYAWDAPGNPAVSVLDDVTPGTYSVTVTDDNGCTAVGTGTIDSPAAIVISFDIEPISCSGASDAGLSAIVSGGQSPFSYAWSVAGANDTSAISNLSPGVYSLTITDANGCSAEGEISIFEPDPLIVLTTADDVLCSSDSDGIATANPQGGTSPYNFNWSDGQTTQSASGLAPGSYSVTVTDAHGCQSSATAVVNYTSDFAISTTGNDVNCYAGSDGSATVNATGGSAPYTFAWSNGDSASIAANLSAGTFSVTVVDAAGCVLTDSVSIGEPPLMSCIASVVSPITTFGGNDGIATVETSGGTAPHTYTWDSGSVTDTASNLAAGTHSVTVTDANGCTCVTHISLTNPSKIGNFIWNDLNQNGIQDPGEPGVPGVDVHLTGNTFGSVPVDLTTTSDSSGYYAFDGLAPGFYNLEFGLVPNAVYTYHNVGDDALDSDVDPATGETGGFPLASGYYNQTIDCGLIVLDEVVNVGNYVWLDTNRDGIQDSDEYGIQGVTVKLYAMPGEVYQGSRVTDFLGHYLFEDVPAGDYFLEFVLNSLPNGYSISPKDQGTDDNLDSDADQLTGRTAVFTVQPFTLDLLGFDMGAYKDCDNVTDGGLVGYDEDLCGLGADPSEIVSLAPPTGGFGDIEYLWLYSHIPIYNGPGDPNWTPIPNSNSPTYDPGPLLQSTYFIRCSRRVGCTEYPGETNIISKVIQPYPLTQIIDEPGTLCENEAGRFEAAIAGGGATYEWDFGPGAVPQTANTRVVNGVTWAVQGVKTVTLTVTRFDCSLSVSTTVTVNNCFQPLIVVEDLEAVVNGERIDLSWRADANFDEVMYFIQRSEDGVQFENLGALSPLHALPGGGFEFTDLNPKLGDNIYRIKYKALTEDDFEGYSTTAMAHFQPDGVSIITAYPNPTKGNLVVELLEPNEEQVLVEITTPYGQVMKRIMCPGSVDKHQLDLSDLPEGVYMVRVKQKGLRDFTHRIVKMDR